VPLASFGDGTGTPTSKSVPVAIRRCAQPPTLRIV